jgi:hypothetical protein
MKDEEKKLSEKVPEEVSGEGDTSLGSSDQHSDAPGPHGTGKIYDEGEGEEEEDEG